MINIAILHLVLKILPDIPVQYTSVPSRILTGANLPKYKFIAIFAQRFHYFEDPFYKFFALNLLFQDTN